MQTAFGNQFFEGAIVGQQSCPTCNCLWQLYPRLRLASFGPDGTSLMQLKKYLQCVGVATLIGAEGDCALVGGIIREPWFP